MTTKQYSSSIRTFLKTDIAIAKFDSGSSQPASAMATDNDEFLLTGSRNFTSLYEADNYFGSRNNDAMYYCSQLDGFIPSQLCQNRQNNSLSIAACPSNSFENPTLIKANPTNEQMNYYLPYQARSYLGQFTPTTTKWYPSTFRTYPTGGSSTQRSYTYHYNYNRNI